VRPLGPVVVDDDGDTLSEDVGNARAHGLQIEVLLRGSPQAR
jgi:hypothetical protein